MNRVGSRTRSWTLVVALLFALVAAAILVPILVFKPSTASEAPIAPRPVARSHMSHAHFFAQKFKSPQEVTESCLQCHKQAASEVMTTAHFTWLSGEATASDGKTTVQIGKKNVLNNFCISVAGNWASCTQCHAGYGWKDQHFDFKNPRNVDCLVCHDWSGTYAKTKGGLPRENVDLNVVARSVGYPKRENCGTCHFYGGGGLGVKHGDLDTTLNNASAMTDTHMGQNKMLCVDCHKSDHHQIAGKFNSTYPDGIPARRVTCTDCHQAKPHQSERLNAHVNSVACQTCHIPTFARRVPTKMFWDWSKAGDATRKDDPHKYLKIKGEFVYEENVVPEYHWFNLKMGRYLLGDKINSAEETPINSPLGDIHDAKAKIWPFKVHRAMQPFDKKNNYLLSPVTGGEGGYWQEFNWDKAFRLGSEITKVPYSGSYGFAKTRMYWPLSHMVTPKSQALQCMDCHGSSNKRMNWKELGYDGDPMEFGGRTHKREAKP